ncbi:MAG: DNA replication complex GINS family protein [Thermoplasmata archaeon]|nr:DNA replication complex GINS family protein [Thermoplasmata archaeon]
MDGSGDKGDITLTDLNEVLRREQKSRALLSLPLDFYERAQDYISSLEEEIRAREEEVSPSLDIMELEELRRKSERALNKIFMERLRKVLLLAYANIDGELAKTDVLTREEKILYENILEQARDIKKTTLGTGPSSRRRRLWHRITQKKRSRTVERAETLAEEKEEIEKAESVEEVAPAPQTLEPARPHTATGTEEEPEISRTEEGEEETGREEKEEEEGTGPAEEEEPLEDMATILVLEEIPPFAGPAGEYHLKPQDLASIPRKMAEILEKKTGKVRIIE